MTPDEAVAALDAISPDGSGDHEGNHVYADEVLMYFVPEEVAEAYERLKERADWWVYA